MANAVDIVLADALATPVNHTFTPTGFDGPTLWFEDQSAAAVVGNWKISVKLQRPAAATAGTVSSSRMYRVSVGLHEPILETLSNTSGGILAAPQVSYIPRVVCEFVLPERSTLQNRKDLRKMIASLLANAQITAVVENLLMPT
jgi:hypothetical protein